MKSIKKITAFVLTLALAITLITVYPSQTNAKVTIKSSKKVTIIVGKSTKITVKQKGAKFTSSNKKIATVTKAGKVKAKSPGTCKITVKVKKSSKKVTINVVPGAATIETSSSPSESSVKLSWSRVSKATGYDIFASTNASTGFILKATVGSGATTTYTVGGLTKGTTYYFKVRAFTKVGSKKLSSTNFSNVMTQKVYALKWNDEFSGNELDTTKWNNIGAQGKSGTGYGNGELQNYQMDYCEVTGGSLVIKPQFEYNPRTGKVLENQIYSTKLWTKDQYEFTYGKVEFRAKLPKGQGTWAACWMLGNDNNYGKWPLCGEIDILETTSEAAKITIPQSIHCKRFNGDSSSSGNKYKSTTVSTATSEYHTYGIEWTSQEIKFFIDGEFTWSYNPNKYVAVGDGHSNYEIWPYNKQAYLIINCAVGGTLGGTVGTDYWTKVSDKTYDSGAVNSIYQDYMYVDYVRVYQ